MTDAPDAADERAWLALTEALARMDEDPRAFPHVVRDERLERLLDALVANSCDQGEDMRQRITTWMSRSALAALLGLASLAAPACEPVPAASANTVKQDAASKFSGNTILYYEDSHGNQIEYYDPAGRAFLWYPGNRAALPGMWKADAQGLCSKYGENSFNPVTGEYGGEWSCTPITTLDKDIVDTVRGDVFGLATGNIPFSLHSQPRFGSIAEVKDAP